MTRVLVTGATGFIAQSLIPALLKQGTEVNVLVRNPELLQDPFLPSLNVFTGDLRDADAVRKAVHKVEGIYHLAAATVALSLKHSRAVNVGGVTNLVNAIRVQQSPPKLVYVSSLAASGPTGVQGVVENQNCHPVSHYGKTKLEAEQALREVSQEVRSTIVRPACVFGPWDRNLLLMMKSIKHGWNVCAGSAKYQFSFLHVHDLVEGLLSAMQRGQLVREPEDESNTGLYYLADPKPITFVELAEFVRPCVDRDTVRTVTLPLPVCYLAAYFGEFLGRITGRLPFLNLDKVREARGGNWVCHPDRAMDELNFQPKKSMQAHVIDTHDWYRNHGWMPPPR